MSSGRNPRSSYLQLGPRTVRILSAVALFSLNGWFLLKFLLVRPLAGVEQLVGALALLGMVSAVVVFLSTYSFQAHAAKDQIDERELLQRNEAYFRTHQILLCALLAGLLVLEFWQRATGLSLSVQQMGNFLTLLFFCAMVLPAALLAWHDRQDSVD